LLGVAYPVPAKGGSDCHAELVSASPPDKWAEIEDLAYVRRFLIFAVSSSLVLR
jgi:hypothetical protein